MPRMDEGIRVAETTVIPLDEIELRASRSSGPGGQHANVTSSRIEAVFDVEGSGALSEPQRALLRRKLGDRVTAVAQDARSQARNRELALERLREKIAAGLSGPSRAVRPSPRAPPASGDWNRSAGNPSERRSAVRRARTRAGPSPS